MIQLQHRRHDAQALAGALPADGWQVAAADGPCVALRHPARPGFSIEAKTDWGSHLLGTTFSVWLRTQDGAADVLRESVLAGRDLAEAALADVRWTYGAEGRAANALVRLLGAEGPARPRSRRSRPAHPAPAPDPSRRPAGPAAGSLRPPLERPRDPPPDRLGGDYRARPRRAPGEGRGPRRRTRPQSRPLVRQMARDLAALYR